MRIGTLLFCAVVAGILPMRLMAQFIEPSSEELKMTSEAKAPGAAAVYLNYEETTDDKLHSKMVYVRVKVLTEKGKELATVEPWYFGDFKVEDIKARTIHADGTVIPLTGKPEELLVAKLGDNKISRKVFTLPSVEVGSILEYRYFIRYDDHWFSSPRWEVQKKYFVRKSHYRFTPSPTFLKGSEQRISYYLQDHRGRSLDSLIWTSNLTEGAKLVEDPTGRFDIALNDIPPLPNEDWMPPADAVAYHLGFYYSPSLDHKTFWSDEGKLWAKDIDKFAEPSKTLQTAVAGLVASTDSETDKAKKIYAAVQALNNTDFTREIGANERKALNLHVVKKAEDVWTQKAGDTNEIALLYLAMLRAAGLKAIDMRVINRNERALNGGKLDFGQFDDDIIVVTLDGKPVMADPGQKMCTFGQLHWKHAATPGVVQGENGPAFGNSPEPYYLDNKEIRKGEITVDELGGVTGSLTITMNGNVALEWRQMALRSDLEDVKKRFDDSLSELVPEGVEAHVDHFLGLDNPDQLLLAVVKVNGALGTATAKRMILPALFLETRARHPFVEQEKRTQPIDMHYAKQVTDEVVYHLPEGFAVEGSVAESTQSWPGKANFGIKARVTPNSITVARQLSLGFTVLKAEEYQQLRGFYQKVAAADQQQIVLSRTSGTAGN